MGTRIDIGTDDPKTVVFYNGQQLIISPTGGGGSGGGSGGTGGTGGGTGSSGGFPVFTIAYPAQGQLQIPTDPVQARMYTALVQALQNWPQDGAFIEYVVPADLPPFNNQHTGTLSITPLGGGGSGNLPSGYVEVDGVKYLPFFSEMPSFSWAISNPGYAAFNTNRGSRVRFFMSGGGQWTFLLSTPNRY